MNDTELGMHLQALASEQKAANVPLVEAYLELDLGNTQDTGQFILGCPLSRYNP